MIKTEIINLLKEFQDILKNHQIAIERNKKDLLKITKDLETLKQADINLKFLIGKNGKVV